MHSQRRLQRFLKKRKRVGKKKQQKEKNRKKNEQNEFFTHRKKKKAFVAAAAPISPVCVSNLSVVLETAIGIHVGSYDIVHVSVILQNSLVERSKQLQRSVVGRNANPA